MKWEENNLHTESLNTKVDTITTLLVVVIMFLALTMVLLGLSHTSHDKRLNVIEQVLWSETQ
jgi:hypothetical protein